MIESATITNTFRLSLIQYLPRLFGRRLQLLAPLTLLFAEYPFLKKRQRTFAKT